MTDPGDDVVGARGRWLAGLCPCCGSELCPWEWAGTEHQPEAVAEGVFYCGRCIGNEHHADPSIVSRVLAALVP